jgi:ribonuclease P protein component
VRAQLSFAAADRLHRSAEFLRLQRNGVRFQGPHFVVYAGSLDNDPTRSRLGVTVSRRIGNAVVRNRVKRRVRECFRKAIRAELPPLTSVVVIARAGAASLKSPAINDELIMAARNLRGRIALPGRN